MKVEIVMPKMGESLQEGTIIRWLKKEGDFVERDEMILEISTDKVDTEVPAPASGILVQIIAKENETVEVGKVIAILETEASEYKEQSAPQTKMSEDIKKVEEPKEKQTESISTATTEENIVDVVMPKMGESLQEGTIIKWLKKVGDKVERDEMILEISTDKVDTEVPAPVSGIITEILAKEGETIEVGKVIAKISTGKGKVTVKQTQDVAEPITHKQEPQVTEEKIEGKFFSPVVKKIAAENNISLQELNSIKGTGIDGRVTKEDLLKYIETRKQPKPKEEVKKPDIIVPPPTEIVKTPPTTPTVFGADKEIIPMDRVRQLIAEHMVFSKRTSAHVTSVAEADVTEIVKFKQKYQEKFQKEEGFKLTYTPFFAKAVIEAVQQYKMINVSVEGTNIIRHIPINLSFATALDDGNLIVPVIKNAETLNIKGLARAIYDLSTRARSKKLNPDEIQGGTITITNVGAFGTLFGTPIINQPQTAIFGIGAIQKRPVVKEFKGDYAIVIRDMVYLSITYDHRVIDGMLAGQALSAFVKAIEAMNESNISL